MRKISRQSSNILDYVTIMWWRYFTNSTYSFDLDIKLQFYVLFGLKNNLHFLSKTIYALRLGSSCALKFAIRKVQTFWASGLMLGEWIREAHIRGGAHFRRWSQARPTVPHFHPSLPHTIQPQLCILGIKRKAHDLLRRIIHIHFI